MMAQSPILVAIIQVAAAVVAQVGELTSKVAEKRKAAEANFKGKLAWAARKNSAAEETAVIASWGPAIVQGAHMLLDKSLSIASEAAKASFQAKVIIPEGHLKEIIRGVSTEKLGLVGGGLRSEPRWNA